MRQTSYSCTDELNAANLGIGIQIPKEIREARKPLYPVMKKAKDEGNSVRFNGKTLLINGKEYTSDQQMEHYLGHEERSLKVLSWNVHGLKQKIADTDFWII